MGEIRRILVPLDFSPSDADSLEQTWQLAAQHGSEVHLLHVHTASPLLAATLGPEQDACLEAEAALDRLRPPQAHRDIKVVRRVLTGLASQQITDYASQQAVDLIIMGTQGRSGWARAVLGSVAERVLRTSPCPVMTLRRPVDETGSHQAVDVETSPAMLTPGLDLIRRGVAIRATDIHIDPIENDDHSVRVRIDGRLQQLCRLDKGVADHLIRQLKNFASFDIAEPFRPQEGRLRLPAEFAELEVRLTTAHVMGGESASLRVLSRTNIFHPLGELGFAEQTLDRVQQMIEQRDGLVLITGPTNAGKTTTVYAMLAALNAEERHIVSIEDPVEFDAPFVRQLGVDEAHGLSMQLGLKTLLRMDPDVVFLGEIRDAAAAEIAMRAASSGRHVLSTMHTRDVASTVTAAIDLGIDRRSLAGNLAGIINQRLVRRLCPDCASPYAATDKDRQTFLEWELQPPAELVKGSGCAACRETGYQGRIGVFETLTVDDEFRHAIVEGLPEDEFRQLIGRHSAASLLADALQKVADHVTSLQEALEMQWSH